MDSLETAYGHPVDPGIELDRAAETEAETVAGETPNFGASASSSQGPTASAATTGRHAIRGEIARGGMGAIFEVRDIELRRSLAMKVILARSGGSGGAPGTAASVPPELMQRFLEEAQVTAQLVHPGVVPIHELGIDHAGRVFFTMSLVRGETLSSVIRKARAEEDGWSMTRALQVLTRVCETMAFAHDKGVIHRDLKPDNVMVGKFGEVYVMDWGLAKVLGREGSHDLRLREPDPTDVSSGQRDASESASPLMTMDGAVLGTPAYMPPEQAEGRIDDLDKRSDVYAIGTLLYQLLTGTAPYVRSGARLGAYEILAAVTAGPPASIHELDEQAPEELEAICDKAMARAQSDRYSSAQELSEELHRFLSGHVVRAHRTGALVEMKKWIARNKAVASTIAAATVLVAALTTVFLFSLADERDRAQQAEIAADDERGRAENLASFMLVDLRDRLVPLNQLEVLGAVAQKSLEYYESLPTDGLTDDERGRRALAFQNVGQVFNQQGDLESAARSFRGAIEIRARLVEDDPEDGLRRAILADCRNGLGNVLLADGDLEGARTAFEQVEEVIEGLEILMSDPPSRAWLAHAQSGLAKVELAEGNTNGAIARTENVIAIHERNSELDPENFRWPTERSNAHIFLGDLWAQHFDQEKAIANFEEAVRIREEWIDDLGPLWLAEAVDRVGNERRRHGDIPGAITAFRRLEEISRQIVEENPTDMNRRFQSIRPHLRLGHLLLLEGDAESAKRHATAAVEIMDGLEEHDPTNFTWKSFRARAHWDLGRALRLERAFAESLSRLRRAEEIHQEAVDLAPHLADQHKPYAGQRRTAEIMAGEREAESSTDHIGLAYAYKIMAEFEAAVTAYERAFEDEAHWADVDSGHLWDAVSCACLASVDAPEQADELRTKALDWLSRDFGLRRTKVAAIEAAVTAGEQQASQLDVALGVLQRQLDHIRDDEPKLDAIRGMPEFAKLMEEQQSWIDERTN